MHLSPILQGPSLLAIVEGGCGKKDGKGGERAEQDATDHVEVGEVSECYNHSWRIEE